MNLNFYVSLTLVQRQKLRSYACHCLLGWINYNHSTIWPHSFQQKSELGLVFACFWTHPSSPSPTKVIKPILAHGFLWLVFIRF